MVEFVGVGGEADERLRPIRIAVVYRASAVGAEFARKGHNSQVCFAALGCRSQRCRYAGLHIRVKVTVHKGFLKLVPFIGAALFGFRDLPRPGHFLFRGGFLQIARPDYLIHLSLLDTLRAARMANRRRQRGDIDKADPSARLVLSQYRSGTNCLPRSPASGSYLSCFGRFGSFTLSRGTSSAGTTLRRWVMQFRRAVFLSSERIIYHGA